MKPFNLDNEPKINPGFKVPEGYFSTLEQTLMEQLPQRERRVVPLYRRRPFWASTAAAMVVLAGVVTVYFNDSESALTDDNAIENYLVYQGSGISYDLIQNLSESDISALEASVAVSDDAVVDYLTEQNIIINE